MKILLFFTLLIFFILTFGEVKNIRAATRSETVSREKWSKMHIDSFFNDIVMYDAKQVSHKMNSSFHYKLLDVLDARKEIKEGFTYRINIRIKETICKKSEISFEAAQTCQLSANEKSKICTVLTYVAAIVPWLLQKQLISFSCRDIINSKTIMRSEDLSQPELLFKNFMSKYKKVYSTTYEKQYRFKTFQNNLKKIHQFNLYEKGTATYGITEFTDLSDIEFHDISGGFRPRMPYTPAPPPLVKTFPISIPNSFDWRDHGAVTEVKTQKICGSSWAFSVAGNIEGQWAIKKKMLFSVSAQALIDCDKKDRGCNGGFVYNTYPEIIRIGGIATENDYPYRGNRKPCGLNKFSYRIYINTSVSIPSNETEMAIWLVKNGPISAGINSNAMQFYLNGISHPSMGCDTSDFDIHHAVLIVGYGVQTFPSSKKTIPFWIIKNSWGKDWGENGYYRLYRGEGICAINVYPTSAIVF